MHHISTHHIRPSQQADPTWHQHPMCHFPIVLPGVCSEEPIVYSIPDLFQSSRNSLREALLIADFIQKLVGRNEDLISSTETELKDRAY